MSTLSMEQKLTRAQIAIDNVLADADLVDALASFGYNTARLHQGSALRETARTMMRQQRAIYGNFFEAQEIYKGARQQMRLGYMDHIKIARVAFKQDRGARQTLGLAAPRRFDLAGLIVQARLFYDAALADTDILSRLATFGITSATLASGHEQVIAVSARDAARQQHKGSAFDATQQRDAAFAALEEWMRDFLKIVHIALKDRPQLLTQLGITAPVARRGRATEPPATMAQRAPVADAPAAETPVSPTSEQTPPRRNGRAALSGQKA